MMRYNLLPALGCILLCAFLLGVGCNKDKSETKVLSSQKSAKSPYEGKVAYLDWVKRPHLAELSQQGGIVMDFGTPDQDKYTSGDWKTGWLQRKTQGETSFAWVGPTGRVYFPAEASRAMTLKLRLRPYNNSAMLLFLNGKELPSINFSAG